MVRGVAGVALAGLMLAACQSSAWNNRYGPNPRIAPSEVDASLLAQQKFMAAFYNVAAAGTTTPSWYYVTVAGFNYVDEVCDEYLVALFKIDRRRYLASRGISLAGAAASTILGAYDANPHDIAAVASAFGFGSSFADAVGNKYIFSDKPELIYGTVEKLRREKRKLASGLRDTIDSEPASYAEIRSYLALCLPPVIDAYITKVIAVAEAKPADTGPPGHAAAAASPRATSTDVKLE